jgi:predicted unusual protein kinase regulating ubiquinone biosynthesis (AarF/ABC1/UbiB family)
MTDLPHPPAGLGRGLPVPGTRLGRMARLGGLSSGIAGGAVLEGARRLARGERPGLPDLLLTPANAARLTAELARMRGAAMKLGQLLSMDTGDLLPPELAAIMARLRSEAHPMPARQLRAVLIANWGADWQRRFARFDVTPLAAASIGQVHRARTRDGREMAVKIQYPGVRRSIDSDVANVAALIRLSGLLPAGLDLAPLLDEARRQLHEEADYLREADHLARFGALLVGEEGLRVPALHSDLTTAEVLAMDFVAGVPVESLHTAPQALRDSVATRLVALTLREMFDLGWMQTDPNFANYRYDAAGDRLVLLDFGATRAISPELSAAYRALLRAGLAGDGTALMAAAEAAGLTGPQLDPQRRKLLLSMADVAFAPLRRAAPFDVAAEDMLRRLGEMALAGGLGLSPEGGLEGLDHVPPMDTLFLQRKLGGVYLMAHRLRARIDFAPLLAPVLDGPA